MTSKSMALGLSGLILGMIFGTLLSMLLGWI